MGNPLAVAAAAVAGDVAAAAVVQMSVAFPYFRSYQEPSHPFLQLVVADDVGDVDDVDVAVVVVMDQAQIPEN